MKRTVTILCAGVWLALSASTGAQQKDDPAKLPGREANVCGTVVTYTYLGDGCTVQLYMVQPTWRPLFYAEIPDLVRPRFDRPPETQFLDQRICVSGTVSRSEKGVPFITVTAPNQIEQTTANTPRPPFGGAAFPACGKDIDGPTLVKEVRPEYPSAKLALKGIEGMVLLEAVVGIDGAVTDMRVIFADVPEFGGAAQKALAEWRFTPGTRDGQTIPVIVQVEMTFTLRARSRK